MVIAKSKQTHNTESRLTAVREEEVLGGGLGERGEGIKQKTKLTDTDNNIVIARGKRGCGG